MTPILPFGTAPWIKRITAFDHEFRGTKDQIQNEYADKPEFIAVESGQLQKQDEFLFGMFKLIKAKPYLLKLGSVELSLATMGDVLVKLNETSIKQHVKLEEISLTAPENAYQYRLIKTDRGDIGVVQEQSAELYFASMFFEVFTQYLRQYGKILNPHEMTRSQWNAANIIGSAAYTVYPCLTTEQSKENIQPFCKRPQKWESMYGAYQSSNLIVDLFYHYCGYGHNGPSYGNGGDTNSRHEVHVAYSLAQGKHVPEVVLRDYENTEKSSSDILWMKELMQFPELRGVMSVPKLRTMLSLLRHEKYEITNSNVENLIQIASEVSNQDPSYAEMDDALTSSGILQDLPVPELKEKFDPSTLENDLAKEIRRQIIDDQIATETKTLNERLNAKEISMREFKRRHQLVDQLRESGQVTWANRYATAIRDKDLAFLLSVLDTPDTGNASTKRAIEKMCNVKLLGLRAQQRHDAVFALCNVGQEEQAKIEGELKKQEEQRDFKRKKKSVLNQMEKHKINSSKYGLVSVKEYVEKSVEEGFNRISRQVKGASFTYWLRNPTTGHGTSIRKVDGSFEYASDVLQLEKMY